MTLVMKFGGTSVGSAEAIQRTAELIKQYKDEYGRVVVIASAMGSKPVKVTDLLLQGSNTAVTGDQDTYKTLLKQMRHIHFTAIDQLLNDEHEQSALKEEIDSFLERYGDLCGAISVLGEISPRAADAIGGMGEQMSVRIVAAYLRQVGIPAAAIDATDLIVTDDNFTSAVPLIEQTNVKTRARLDTLLEDSVIPIVTGFIAATKEGITTTLGRGGSDYSASIIGRALNAQEVWIWTDVDGVMSADPRWVESAKTIPQLTYREVSELAYYGAKVLHPRTMRPVMESHIPLRIKNTFNPEHAGSVIVYENDQQHDGIKAVTAIRALSLITVEGRGMLGVPGVAARTFKAVADSRASILMITQSSSEQSICFVLSEDTSSQVVMALEHEFGEELKHRDIERIWSLEPCAIVTAVGAGMQGTPGIAGKMFTALGDNDINIVAIAQGSSECSISVVVSTEQVSTAVQAVHQLIAPA